MRAREKLLDFSKRKSQILLKRSKIFWILQKTASRPLKDTSPFIQTALVCGTYQIFYMDRVPDRAAVNRGIAMGRGSVGFRR